MHDDRFSRLPILSSLYKIGKHIQSFVAESQLPKIETSVMQEKIGQELKICSIHVSVGKRKFETVVTGRQ